MKNSIEGTKAITKCIDLAADKSLYRPHALQARSELQALLDTQERTSKIATQLYNELKLHDFCRATSEEYDRRDDLGESFEQALADYEQTFLGK
jgi:regulator of sirC expression with transglutaminase-like and TPR domain